MLSVRSERQRLDPFDRRKRHVRVEMGKQGAAARGLEDQLLAQSAGVDGNQQQIGLSAEMAFGCFYRLVAG